MNKDCDTQNERVIWEMWEDFEQFLAKHDYKNARAVLDNVGELGWESDALRMHHLLNEAENELHFEPVSQENIPTITPEEDDAPERGFYPEWVREGDKNVIY